MRKFCLYFLLLFSVVDCKSQSTYVVDYWGKVYSIDFSSHCTSALVYTCRHDFTVDIAADPLGNIYTCVNDSIYFIDISNASSDCVYVGKFADGVTGLLFSNDGNLYGSGVFGLSKYNPVTGTVSFIGSFPTNVNSAGDMVEFNNKIYMSAPDGGIYEINKTEPWLSTLYLNVGEGAVYGMAIISTKCYDSPDFQKRLLAFEQTGTNTSRTYIIDMENKISFPGFCDLQIGVMGATSVSASNVAAGEIKIKSMSVVPPLCAQNNNGTIRITMANSDNNRYQYSLDGGPSSTDPLFVSLAAGPHTIRVKNQFGCFSDTTVLLSPARQDCSDTVFIPTAFTPDGNGRNDVLRAIASLPVSNFELRIYNRYGQHIFSSYDINAGWDGRFQSKRQPPGVYVWHMRYRNFAGKEVTRKGIVTLIR